MATIGLVTRAPRGPGGSSSARIIGKGTFNAVECGTACINGHDVDIAVKTPCIFEAFGYSLLAAAAASPVYSDVADASKYVCEVYGITLQHGVPELIMQRCGSTLFDWSVHQSTTYSLCKPSGIHLLAPIRDALRGLYALHEAGIVHGDMQPRNMAFVNQGLASERLVLLDLNTSRAVFMTERVHVSCTDGYRSPCAPCPVIAPAFDLYAIAILLLNVVTGGQAGRTTGLPSLPVACALASNPYGHPGVVSTVTDNNPTMSIQRALASSIMSSFCRGAGNAADCDDRPATITRDDDSVWMVLLCAPAIFASYCSAIHAGCSTDTARHRLYLFARCVASAIKHSFVPSVASVCAIRALQEDVFWTGIQYKGR